MRIFQLVLILSLLQNSSFAMDAENEIQREKYTDRVQVEVLSTKPIESLLGRTSVAPCIPLFLNCQQMKQYFVDALIILSAEESEIIHAQLKRVILSIDKSIFSIEERIRLNQLASELGIETKPIDQTIMPFELSRRAQLLLKDKVPRREKPVSKRVLKDLFYKEPKIEKYNGGRYKSTPRIYMFCRTKREYPCLFVMRGKNGDPVYLRNSNKLWSHPSLGFSRKKLPPNKFNGHTPAGILRIDGVMPEANKQKSFGKNRRLILNFVGESDGEKHHKWLLPRSSHNHSWWTQALVARDIGRGLFRVHGTGTINQAPKSSYYPFVGTIGCVAQRENTYGKIKYNDQRLLLDKLMEVSDLESKFENEEKIKGLLYIVEINSIPSPVTLDELNQLGIK